MDMLVSRVAMVVCSVAMVVGSSVMGQSSDVKKQLYLPAKITTVPEGNDFEDNESEYSYHRMAQSDNVVAFWSKSYGDDPKRNSDPDLRFDIEDALAECERFYNYYLDELKYVERGNSVSDNYKFVLFVIGDTKGAAFGGGSENVGMMWFPATRMHRKPYCTIAHELAHAFQYVLRLDGGGGLPGGYNEMQAQWFLWQAYPEWMTLENYHLKDFMKKTHFAFLHPTNMYHSPYVLEYWCSKHGQDFMGKLSREAKQGEDAVMAYQRLTNISHQQFNDEMIDAYLRFMTWDIERIREVAKPYANGHDTQLKDVGKGWYQIKKEFCPQNYGYNGIELAVPKGGTKVTVDFKGVAGADGFSNVNTEKAGWRYGFVAHKKDGTREYSEIFSKNKGRATFIVPEETEHLWLTVMGAPAEHWKNPGGRNQSGVDAQWPYQIKIKGSIIK